MKNIVRYNLQNIDFPTPIVEVKNRNIYLDKPWGTDQEIVLKGQLTGSFQELQLSQKKLIDLFSKNFKKLEVLEKNSSTNLYDVVYEKDNVQITNIAFDQSTYSNLLDYTIDLKILRPRDDIINPKNDFNFELNKDNTINLNHSISALGVRTQSSSSNALYNAINYVKSLTGLSSLPAYQNIEFYLVSVKESINRLQSTYSLEEIYNGDNSEFKTSSGINRYTVDISSGIKDFGLKISLQGQMFMPRTGNFDQIKNLINPTGIIYQTYTGYFNPVPISYSLQENKNENSLSYSFEFDNINLPNPYIRYTVSEQYDNIYKTSNKNISAEVLARGHQYKRLLDSENLLNLINLGDIAGPNFKKIGSEKVINKDKNTFVVSANFTDKIIPGGYLDGKYTVSQEIPVTIVKPNLGLNGYVLQDFDTKTFPKTTVRGDFKGAPNGTPGVNSSNFTKNSQSYDPETKSFSYNIEYYGGTISGLPF